MSSKSLPSDAFHLDDFTLFSKLPPELRIKVWRFAARSHPRVFELEWRYHKKGDHSVFKVSKQTNQAPAITEVSKESRGEGMRIFEKRVFNNYIHHCIPYLFHKEKIPCTWFNPDLDIICFGENTCIQTVGDFFYLFGHTQLPKIAFMMNIYHHWCGVNTSCNWNNDHQNISCIQALHGKPKEDGKANMLTGSPSTKAIFLVVQSTCYKFRAGQMPNTVTFRPALQKSGSDFHQAYARDRWVMELDCVKSGFGFGCGPSQWTDGRGPDFKFVSLAPSLKDGKGKEHKQNMMEPLYMSKTL
ncbi:hypothetical protein EAF04_004935 [Stromatinia cepivora]|nr:hypothetical protein EAF04_004935 [Stromatinia cepivora]